MDRNGRETNCGHASGLHDAPVQKVTSHRFTQPPGDTQASGILSDWSDAALRFDFGTAEVDWLAWA